MNNLQVKTEEELQKYRQTQDKEQVEYIYLNFKSYLYQFAGYLKFQQNPKQNKNVQDFAVLINSRYKYFKTMFRNWEIEDIFGELFIQLLNFIKNCKSENILPYIAHCFKYYILEWIRKLGNDYMNHNEIEEYNSNNDSYEDIYKENIFDDNNLNNIENYIIYLYYIKNLSIREIGILLHSSPTKISEFKETAENKLKQLY